MLEFKIKHGSYTEESVFHINAVMRKHGMTIGQAIRFIEEEIENGRDPLDKNNKEKAKADTSQSDGSSVHTN